jgi:hypothetical protein
MVSIWRSGFESQQRHSRIIGYQICVT